MLLLWFFLDTNTDTKIQLNIIHAKTDMQSAQTNALCKIHMAQLWLAKSVFQLKQNKKKSDNKGSSKPNTNSS